MKLTGQRNQCPTCAEFFNSTAAFDKHRTGHFGRDRRCMTADEMRARGMVRREDGFWRSAENPMWAKADALAEQDAE